MKFLYTTISGSSMSASDDTESLLYENETKDDTRKDSYIYDHSNSTRKVLLIISIFTILGALAFMASRSVSSLLGVPSTPENIDTSNSTNEGLGPGHSNHQCAQCQDKNVQSAFDDSHRPSDKDSSGAEYLMKSPCGETAEEARARGCRFGMMYSAWLPDACYDDEMEEEFKNHTNWRFWLYPNQTGEATWDDVAKGEYDYVFVEWEFHLRHCIDMTKKFHRAVTSRGLLSIDSVLAPWQHLEHCAHALMKRDTPLHVLNTVNWRKFPDCGLLHW